MVQDKAEKEKKVYTSQENVIWFIQLDSVL